MSSKEQDLKIDVKIVSALNDLFSRQLQEQLPTLSAGMQNNGECSISFRANAKRELARINFSCSSAASRGATKGKDKLSISLEADMLEDIEIE